MATRLVVVRHGETDWSRQGRHTGLTDIELTSRGRDEARLVPASLVGWQFGAVVSSPLQRALETAHLAGYEPAHDDNLVEWDYGLVEGRTNDEIVAEQPGWSKWVDEVPGGEQVSDVGRRADAFLATLGNEARDVLVFAHGHFLSILIARWLGLGAEEGRLFPLSTASISVLADKRGDRILAQLNHQCGEHLDGESVTNR